MAPKPADVILLVHGFGAKSLMMWPLASGLRRFGFQTRFWSYVSYFSPIERHAQRLLRHLSGDLMHESRVHIVAHSMGSIVVRAALSKWDPPNLGRVVLLAPPNQGSPLAHFVAPLIGSLIKPTRELSGAPLSFVKQLPEATNFEVGVIAGRFDWMVPPARTFMPSAVDHITVRQTHNSLLVSRSTQKFIAEFLRHGRFRAK